MKNLFCDVIRICIINYGRPEQVLVLSGFIYVTFECWKKWSGCIWLLQKLQILKSVTKSQMEAFNFKVY